MKPTQTIRIPTLHEVHALGLIVTCANRDCRRRCWLDLHELPKHATVTSVAANARCQVCGSKGADVEVIQPVAEIGEQRGKSGPRNIEHAAQLRKYIEEHPVSLWGARSRRSSSDVQ
jgi:hypothetical protein